MGFISDIFNGSKGAGFAAQSANTDGLTTQKDLIAQIQQAQASGQGLTAQQQVLADQLLAQSQGAGPNPAQAQLNQATDANTRNAAAVIASSKGISPALAARLAGETAANTNQTAAGQAATMRANQQIAAEQALQGQQGLMSGANLTQEQMAQQALANQNNAAVSNASQINAANSGVAKQNAANQGNIFGGIMNAAGTAAGTILGGPAGGAIGHKIAGGFSHGGEIPTKHELLLMALKPKHFAVGGPVGANDVPASIGTANTSFGTFGSNAQAYPNWANPGIAAPMDMPPPPPTAAPAAVAPPAPPVAPAPSQNLNDYGEGPWSLFMKDGGEVQSPKDRLAIALLKTAGGTVPGKAKVKGDSPKNDIVPAMVSPDEIVLPRSITMDEHAPEKAKEFVAGIKAKDKLKHDDHQDKVIDFVDALKRSRMQQKEPESKDDGYAQMMSNHMKLDSRIKELEAKLKSARIK